MVYEAENMGYRWPDGSLTESGMTENNSRGEAMSEWRPESWENDFEYKRALEGEYLLPSVVFEAGADAMLAVIWQMAKDSSTGTFVFDSHGMHIFVGRRLENG
ncbi:hypothetical protein LCGC14_3042780 [marine sediment metagenome]|uniref:Uncharacterized protein n=1 Tax=marine sediment metagenome TaxID=412755 RepID=A0A0F8WPL1_9ZZZZ